MRSIKGVLGTGLMEEAAQVGTQTSGLYAPGNRRDIRWEAEQVSAPAFRHMEAIVEEHLGHRVAQDVDQVKIEVTRSGRDLLIRKRSAILLGPATARTRRRILAVAA